MPVTFRVLGPVEVLGHKGSVRIWSHHPGFGSPPWLTPLTDAVTGSPPGVAAITWGSIALEFSLALAILPGLAARRILLVCGLLFHAAIAIEMGLVGFFAAMAAALLLYLLPVGHHLRVPTVVTSWNERYRVRPSPPG